MQRTELAPKFRHVVHVFHPILGSRSFCGIVGTLVARVILVGATVSVSAQPQNAAWFFGSYAGLDFSAGIPVAVFDGQHAGSACGSVCDTLGELLCYVGPDVMFNSQHDTLPNGNALYGDQMRMSPIVIPFPGHPSEYFAFVAKSGGYPDYDPKAFYHWVDISANSGDGLCIEKVVVLNDSVSTMVTAIPHANGTDYWAIFHEWGSNKFLSYLVNSAGVDSIPVESEAGEVHYDPVGFAVTAIGFLKPSADGTQLVLAKTRLSASDCYLDLFDFDPTSGVVSGQLRIADHERFYAAEFSPNGQVLYATLFRCDPLETNDLIQFDISVQDSASINSSRLVLHAAPNQTNCDGAMGVIAQGPDRRLYVALNTVPY
nr:hypothetical protein [Flavobacteriales bacterium]